jgi:acetyl esterase/lipase
MEEPTPDFRTVEYIPEGDFLHVLDVYLPTGGEGPHPAILALHGGGFYARSKDHVAPYARHFNEQGYALVSANYRFAPAATYPAQVEDAYCALAWIHANAAEFGLDADRVFVMGDSAGGYLAAMLGTVETPGLYQGECPYPVQPSISPLGVIVLYGSFDLTNLDGHAPDSIEVALRRYMGAPVSEAPQAQLVEMSPIAWIDGGEPPFLVIHGTEDEEIQSWVSEVFVESLEAADVEADLVLVNAGHAYILDRSSQSVLISLEAIDGFLRNLTGP